MIAMTPMPPTISAIDEMTTSARNVGLADLIPDLQHGVLRREIEVVRLIELEVVADAHDRLDLAHRRVARAVTRHDGDHRRAEHRRVEVAGGDLCRALEHLAVELLVRAVRDDAKSSAPVEKPPGSAACRARR